MNEIFKDIFYVFIIFAAVWAAFYLGTRHDTLEQKMKYYDCSLTEFIPDVPNDVRIECRRQRIESIKSN